MRCLCTGLQASTTYFYAVTQASGDTAAPAIVTPTMHFESAPPSGEAFGPADYPVKIIAFGDVDWTDGVPGDPPGSDPADIGNSSKVTAATCRDNTPKLQSKCRYRSGWTNMLRMVRCDAMLSYTVKGDDDDKMTSPSAFGKIIHAPIGARL